MAQPLPAASATAVISTPDLRQRLAQEPRPRILDVRTPEEFSEGHVPTATNVPLDGLDPAALYQAGTLTAGEKVYLVCRTSNRARKAAALFLAAGHPDSVVVEGGTLAWIAEHFPVEGGPAAGGRAEG